MTRASLAVLILFAARIAEGHEICRFRALDRENPFRRWLASQEVTCVPFGTPAALPPGLWNVFARAGNQISAAPLLIDGDAAPSPIVPQLDPGATLAPLLPEKQSGVLYAPRRGSAFPVDGARMTVPADEPLWLFVLDKSEPVAVIPIAPLAPASERAVDGRTSGAAAVIGWLQVPEADRNAIAKASGVNAPSVHAGSRDADLLPPPARLHGAFFRVRDVAPGNAELRLSGRGWVPDRRVVKVQPGITIAAAPLFVRAAGTLIVHWNTQDDLRALDRVLGSCDERTEPPPQLVIAIEKCAPPRSGRGSEPPECTTFREEKVAELFGNLAIEDVVPGAYRAEMRFGKLPPVGGMASVAPLQVADLRMNANYYTAHGSITRGGEPLGEDVRFEFPRGVGFAPKDEEDYRAVFYLPPIGPDAPITITPCDGGPKAVVLADQPMRPRTRYDIDIPANALTVQVSDTFTRQALPGAHVKLEAMALARPSAVFSATAAANERGDVTWKGVPVRELRITVNHAGYEKRVIEPVTMIRSGTHDVDAQLVPLRGTSGRIVSSRQFDSAIVSWFSPSGSETERADLAPDGTFVYLNRHTPDETMAVVSASHPLWVLRAPETGRRETLTVQFPDATPIVAFDTWLAASIPPGEQRYIGAAVGGVRIPQPLLALHQTLRRNPPLMRGAGPHAIRDLLATGPIDVLLGPLFEVVASRARTLDFFALPQFADAPRQRLEPGRTDVVFTPR